MPGISSQEHYVDISTQKRDNDYVITSVWFSQEARRSDVTDLQMFDPCKCGSPRA